jgi:acyl-CoA synthetase (AMP-forming)/AMP-acid ligase II
MHQVSRRVVRKRLVATRRNADPLDRALTLAQLKADALSFAAGLLALGLNPDELWTLPPTPTCRRPEIAPIVLIQLPNCLPFATVAFGAWAAGLTVTLVSPALTSSEVAWVLQNARPRVIITAAACADAMNEAVRMQKDRKYFDSVPVYTVDVARDQYPLATSELSSTDWRNLFAAPKPRTPSTFDPTQRAATILWSSGTSGKPKGVLLSHHALNFSVACFWHDADYYQGRHQRWLGYAPFYHVFGLVTAFLLAVGTGSTIYTMQAFKLDAMLAAVPARKITYLHMAPPVVVMLAKSPLVEPYAQKGAFASVAGGSSGGAPLGHDVIVEVYKRLGFRVRRGYGLTETCSVSAQRGLGEAEMLAHQEDTGEPHWGVEIKVTGEGSNPSGEILIRSPAVMMAYLPFDASASASPDMSITNEALTPDGWFRTGDVGHLSEGSLFITDRIKELIKVLAFQVAPAELEAVLCGSPEVADAGVVAVHDASEATEWPRAYVVPAKPLDPNNPKQTEALAHRLRVLVEEKTARYKWLRGGIVFVQQVPKSPSGKILRRILRDGAVKGVEVKLYAPRRTEAKAKL